MYTDCKFTNIVKVHHPCRPFFKISSLNVMFCFKILMKKNNCLTQKEIMKPVETSTMGLVNTRKPQRLFAQENKIKSDFYKNPSSRFVLAPFTRATVESRASRMSSHFPRGHIQADRHNLSSVVHQVVFQMPFQQRSK